MVLSFFLAHGIPVFHRISFSLFFSFSSSGFFQTRKG